MLPQSSSASCPVGPLSDSQSLSLVVPAVCGQRAWEAAPKPWAAMILCRSSLPSRVSSTALAPCPPGPRGPPR
eukprot:91101-Prorocentrum_minimum.AAC.1